jgi:tripeptidyl-peptidase-1
MMKLVLAVFCVAFAVALPSTTRVALEGPVTAPSQWTLAGPATPEEKTTLHFFLKHADGAEATLESELMAVSDPKSPRYGQHLSTAQLRELLFVPAHNEAVMTWLAHHNVTEFASTIVGDLIQARVTVAQATEMFQTPMHRFVHTTKEGLERVVFRASEYTVPADVASAVSLVGDLVHFPGEQKMPIVVESDSNNRKLLGGGGGGGDWTNACTGSGGSACKGKVTPAVIKERYGVPAQEASAAANNTMAVAEFQGQYYDDTDLTDFSTACLIDPAVTVTRDVGKNRQTSGVESLLDIEYIGAVAMPVPLTVYYASEYSLLTWIQTVGSTESPGWIHSVSYGNDEVQQTSTAYMQQVAVQLQAIGARGISILFASGDQGVWGRSGHGERFHPDFPGACPWITTVGGTDFKTSSIGEETTWSDGGGGFSDTFAMPSWQKTVVEAYLSDSSADIPPSSYFNASGRGYPDIAALGGQKAPYCISEGHRFAGVAGTSAACPVAAAIFALLNDARIRSGKSPLGFLNPFIYQNSQAFHDVTSGKNNAGSGEGFTAVAGWDAATGFGTPNYEELLKAASALP